MVARNIIGRTCAGMLPVLMSQITLGKTGDTMMCALTILVVMQAVSAQIHSLSALFVYDVYQTYVNPFRVELGVYKEPQIADYLYYNRRAVFVRHAVTVFFSIITFPAALIYMSIHLYLGYEVVLLAIFALSAVLPVCLSVAWHRTTSLGLISGSVVGLAVGVATWLLFTAEYPGGLTNFVKNSTATPVWLTFISTCIGAGGIICVLVSLFSGGLNPARNEQQEWAKCLQLDNPAKSWILQYAVDAVNYLGVPSYQEVGLSRAISHSVRDALVADQCSKWKKGLPGRPNPTSIPCLSLLSFFTVRLKKQIGGYYCSGSFFLFPSLFLFFVLFSALLFLNTATMSSIGVHRI